VYLCLSIAIYHKYKVENIDLEVIHDVLTFFFKVKSFNSINRKRKESTKKKRGIRIEEKIYHIKFKIQNKTRSEQYFFSSSMSFNYESKDRRMLFRRR